MKSSAWLYVIAASKASKIGVTEQAIEKRVAAYKTHNPEARLYASYQYASIRQAREMESKVCKHFGSLQAAAGKEWFLASPSQLVDFVERQRNSFEKSAPTTSALLRASSPKPEVQSLLAQIETLQAVAKSPNSNESPQAALERRRQLDSLKQRCESAFASHFSLGTVSSAIQNEEVVTPRDWPAPDMCALKHTVGTVIGDVRALIQKPHLFRFPSQDHACYFWQHYPLSSGKTLPFAHTVVTMPYVEHLDREGLDALRLESKRFARRVGWTFSDHSEWSWHTPGQTGLFAFQMRSSVNVLRDTFARSLRRFAIEHYSELDTRYCEVEHFQKILDDTCADETFPLNVRSLEELVETYLGPVWGYSLEDNFPFINVYTLLFEAWSTSDASITTNQLEDQTKD